MYARFRTKRPNVADVIVTVGHPHGNVDVPLQNWIASGPGVRPLVAPLAARDRRDGTRLPISIVPLRYRNTRLSRLLIALRLLPDPWSQPPN